LTITLSANVESRLRAAARAEGTDPADLAAALVSEAFASPDDLAEADLIESAREIQKALDEAHQEMARGELMGLDEAFAEIRANAQRRRQERADRAAGAQ